MAGEWPEVALSDLADLSGGFAFKSADYAENGRFILRTLNIRDDCSISRDDGVYLPEELCPQYERFQLRPSDTLFVMVGATLGKVGYVRATDLPALLNQNMWLVRAKPEVSDARFVHYAFRHAVKSNLSWASGSARDFVRRGDYRNLLIPAPPLEKQRAIAHILGTLDDKIELYRKMNETLEAMAQALFKSWFVDFDPVRAKAEDRDPGLPKEIAELFPDSFEDSELGEIPRGWAARPLYETAKFINGAAFKSADFCTRGEGLPVVKIAELKDGISEQTKFSTRSAYADQLIDTGDLLYSWSGSPDTSLDAYLWTKGPGLLNQHIFKVVAPSVAQKRFIYYLLQILRPQLVEIARNKQTTGLGHVTVADMKRLYVCWPSKTILDAFDQKMAPIFERVFNNTIEIQNLGGLRDALLPKLISGELQGCKISSSRGEPHMKEL